MINPRLRALTLVPIVVAACARGEKSGVDIEIDGPHRVDVGRQITLTAETLRGTDHAHRWESGDAAIAEVSAAGVVKGIAPGETFVTVTGEDTERSAEHVLVVVDGGAMPSGTSTGGANSSGTGDTDPGTSSGGDDGNNAVPYYDEWLMSAHADGSSEAFNHWNEDGEIPTSCARCHSMEGFIDYLGDDGSEVGVVNQPAALGSVVDCQTCHADAANSLDWVEFDSGATLTGLGAEARCMTCHQGRGSTDSVDAVITEAGVGDDEVSDMLGFENIHYYPAGATLYAGQARGGYQYEGQVYDRRFRHVPEHNTCVGCHDPHTTAVRFDECQRCHEDAVDSQGVRDVRMIASMGVDYDGDGDTTVGVYYEVQGLIEKLYRAIQRYASAELGQTICYSSSVYPYWFNSASGATAECTEDEASFDNAFAQWSPRLLQATYNYQMARKDPGGYAHNSRYIIKLLHDAITDINTVIPDPVDMSNADREAPGHFNGAGQAARYWDENEAVSASCSKCHSGATGFRFWVEYQTGLEVPETSNGLECYTCHENFEDSYDVIDVDSTLYAGGIELEHDGYDNVCATCHSGREGTATVEATIDSGNLSFRNVHYMPAAGVRNGTESQVGYEYDGRVYAGFLQHDSRTQCAGCHEPETSNHTFRIADVWEPVCRTCHNNEAEAREVRIVHLVDYDGDGDTEESLADELSTLADLLLDEIVMASSTPICYGSRYPYWFVPESPAPVCGETVGTFVDWTPALVRATYNFQLHHVEPGAYAHNFEYMAQLLYDSIEDLGGDVDALIRP